ncbi:hypothetical protein EAE96_003645 [Botrytis aclada]|nr:hypothetical protein EAE96_003645 [Botrytis aclada]
MKETTGKVVTSEGLTGIYVPPPDPLPPGLRSHTEASKACNWKKQRYHVGTDLLHIGQPIGRALEESLTEMEIKWKYYTPLLNLVDDHQGFYFDLRSSRIDSTDLQLSRLDP